eukprot:251542_1
MHTTDVKPNENILATCGDSDSVQKHRLDFFDRDYYEMKHQDPMWKLEMVTIKTNEDTELSTKDAIAQYQQDFIQTRMHAVDQNLLQFSHNTDDVEEYINRICDKENADSNSIYFAIGKQYIWCGEQKLSDKKQGVVGYVEEMKIRTKPDVFSKKLGNDTLRKYKVIRDGLQ